MKDYIKMLMTLCEAHDIELPENLNDLNYIDFGVDREEAMHLIQEIYELNYERIHLEE